MTPILIFTDGACSGNPGPGGWGAIVATPDDRVRELGGGDRHTTNNRMELTAPIEALALVAGEKDVPVTLYTDSTYVIGGITAWVHGWKKNGWAKKDGKAVLNRELWERLHDLDRARGTKGAVTWSYVPGHAGYPGNERCDEISVAFSQGRRPALYDGPLADYPHDLTRIPPPREPNARSASGGAKRGAGSARASSAPAGKPVYLSLVNGTLGRHATWAECNARVRGVSNARYRKASTPEEERAILRGWGVSE